jgi:hypothetical protein
MECSSHVATIVGANTFIILRPSKSQRARVGGRLLGGFVVKRNV